MSMYDRDVAIAIGHHFWKCNTDAAAESCGRDAAIDVAKRCDYIRHDDADLAALVEALRDLMSCFRIQQLDMGGNHQYRLERNRREMRETGTLRRRSRCCRLGDDDEGRRGGMSGGSYDYAYSQLDQLADRIRMRAASPGCADIAAPPHVRLAFSNLLRMCARAAKAIEWNDSADGDRDEEALIRACLGGQHPLAALLDEANDVMKRLRTEIEHGNRKAP